MLGKHLKILRFFLFRADGVCRARQDLKAQQRGPRRLRAVHLPGYPGAGDQLRPEGPAEGAIHHRRQGGGRGRQEGHRYLRSRPAA